MDGLKFPSRNFAFPLSHTDSIQESDSLRTFSASFAACGFKGRPSAGASVLLRTKPTVLQDTELGT